MQKSAQPPTATRLDIANILHFQVKGVGRPENNVECILYANGYQQTYVDVVVDAVNSEGEHIPLTDAQRASIRLVRYDDTKDLEELAYFYNHEQSEVDKLFEYYQGVIFSEPDRVQGRTIVRFWVKTEVLMTLHVGALLTIDSKTYHTCDNTLEIGGKTTAGQSNSSAIIRPVQKKYSIRPSDLIRERIDYDEPSKLDVDLYKFKINPERMNHRITYSTPHDTSFVYDYIGGGKTNLSQYYRRDSKRRVEVGIPGWAYDIEINHEPGVLYATRTKLHGYNDAANEYTRWLSIEIIDEYGNKHPMTIGPSTVGNDGTNTIYII